MADGTTDIRKHGNTPPPPSSQGNSTGASRKPKSRKGKPQVQPGESMARLWAESSMDELGVLCGNLAQNFELEDTAAIAVSMLPQSDGDELMGWLRWRTTWEDEPQPDGTKVCCDIFALPLRGTRTRIRNFLTGGMLSETLVSAMRRSGLASPTSDFVFLPLSLSLLTAALLTLDGMCALRTSMAWASQGSDSLKKMIEGLETACSSAYDVDHEECVLIGMRLVRVLQYEDPVDVFRLGITESVDHNFVKSWGSTASEMASSLGLFIGFPQDLPDAVSFLAAYRANALLEIYPDSPREDYVLHACQSDNGLLLARCDELSTAGPVLIPTPLVLSSHELFMDGVSENATDVVWHAKPSRMPGMRRGATTMN